MRKTLVGIASTDMRVLFFILTIVLTQSCSSESGQLESTQNDFSFLTLPDTGHVKNDFLRTDLCDMRYDTIDNEKYLMHRRILDKYYHKEKRGYFFSPSGDTINHFLYHQDIASFMLGLDSNEADVYKYLTNKVVFLILEKEPRMLAHGLTQWTRSESDLNYFLYHVGHPLCNSISVDTIASVIDRQMETPHQGARQVKDLLLATLKTTASNAH
jgi:hypothetical protein